MGRHLNEPLFAHRFALNKDDCDADVDVNAKLKSRELQEANFNCQCRPLTDFPVETPVRIQDQAICAHIGDSDLVLLHFLYFLTYSFWKSSVPLGITDSCEMALIRRARKSIWKLSQLEEETVEQVLTSIEPSLMIVPRSSTKAVICANGQRKDTMKQVGDDSHADGNSKRSTPVHQSKTEINFISTNELCADLTFVSGLCMFASTIKL
ncbi:hypothetical protein CAPTEDRAFT_210461 [Capitella teleta]|uniref:Uncharacterized protein n=1 Tax=Capitella teleta TaxID=283909 RepID=R7U2H5_CAPTE|nr:hypothetical protein CAPTEDRAFT_210461 [Capitella teleta]|eukprot:ELT97841.1 hypothetical protein CAPTEDRAFT_210461 [Capitella teleta]